MVQKSVIMELSCFIKAGRGRFCRCNIDENHTTEDMIRYL